MRWDIGKTLMTSLAAGSGSAVGNAQSQHHAGTTDNGIMNRDV